MTKLPDVSISGPHLSDLFFNFVEDTPEPLNESTLLDLAIEFVEYAGLDGVVTPNALVEDFLARV